MQLYFTYNKFSDNRVPVFNPYTLNTFKNATVLFAFCFLIKSKYCWNSFTGIVLLVDKEYDCSILS